MHNHRIKMWFSISVSLCLMTSGLSLMSDAYNILMVPGAFSSDASNFLKTGYVLVQRGYNVTMVVSETFEPDGSHHIPFTIYTYETTVFPPNKDEEWMIKALQTAMHGSWLYLLQFNYEEYNVHTGMCESMLQNNRLARILSERNFDFALVGEIQCLAYLPYKLSIPYAQLSVTCDRAKWPHEQSYVPSHYTMFTDTMSFQERIMNTLTLILQDISYLTGNSDLSVRYIPDKTAFSPGQLVDRAAACFLLRDHVTDFPRPLPSNAIYVGGLTVSPEQSLPEEIKNFIEEAPKGIIIISFGSWLEIPESLMRIILDAVKQSPYHFIVKTSTAPPGRLYPNCIVLPWLPLPGLLAVRKTKLLVYHGGSNTMSEAAYLGVPTIVVPFVYDQFHNGAITELKGYGVKLPLKELSQQSLIEKINQVIGSKTITQRTREVSSILQNRLVSPSDTLDYWIKYFVNYGDKYIKSEQLSNLPLLKHRLVDIYVALITMLLIIFLVISRIIGYICGRCKQMPGKLKMG